VLGELSGRVSVHIFGKKSIAWLQTVESDTLSAQPGSADIHVSPDGRFLYASNRADANNISIFSINENDGRLRLIGTQSTKGLVPRNFVIHPSGNWLLVANQVSNNIVVFKRNQQTGLLAEVGEQLNLPTPVCLVFGK
jgi:6-phosphogluconolactonase